MLANMEYDVNNDETVARYTPNVPARQDNQGPAKSNMLRHIRYDITLTGIWGTAKM